MTTDVASAALQAIVEATSLVAIAQQQVKKGVTKGSVCVCVCVFCVCVLWVVVVVGGVVEWIV